MSQGNCEDEFGLDHGTLQDFANWLPNQSKSHDASAAETTVSEFRAGHGLFLSSQMIGEDFQEIASYRREPVDFSAPCPM
jgi:hypothetical protein